MQRLPVVTFHRIRANAEKAIRWADGLSRDSQSLASLKWSFIP